MLTNYSSEKIVFFLFQYIALLEFGVIYIEVISVTLTWIMGRGWSNIVPLNYTGN